MLCCIKICIERQKELLPEQAVMPRDKASIHRAENGSKQINMYVSSGFFSALGKNKDEDEILCSTR